MSSQEKENKGMHLRPAVKSLVFQMGLIRVELPEVGTKEAWVKAKKMMDIYFEGDKQ